MSKIAIVTPYFYPLPGGVENNAYNMALQLVKAGHSVTVYTSHRRDANIFARREEVHRGIVIKRLYRAIFSQYYFTFLPMLGLHLFVGKYDLIHSHIPGVLWTDLCIGLVKLARRCKTVINTPHDPFMSRGNYNRLTRQLKRLYEVVLRFYYPKLYDYVVAVNPNQKGWINDYGVSDDQIILALNGIEEEMLDPVEITPQIKAQFGLQDEVVITTVARYHEYKGYQNLLAALNILKGERKLNIKYFGMGEDRGMLPRLQNYVLDNDLSDWVTLLESPSDIVRDQLLQISQLFVLPSRVEAFGIGILQAMAKGNAIITTTTEGGKYLVGPENGYLFEFGDVNKLAELILELVTDSEKRAEFSRANLKKAATLTWQKTTKDYLKLVSNLSTFSS